MSFIRKSWVAVTLGFLTASACAENNQSMFILGAIFPAKDTGTGACSYDATSNKFVLNPVVDVALTDGYTANFAVESQLLLRENYTQARAESNTTIISGADIRVVDGDRELDFYSTLTSGSPVTAQHGRTAVPVQVISPKAAEALRTSLRPGERRLIVSYVKLVGRTVGNQEVESGEYQFVMSACKQCLISFPPDSRNTANPVNNCDNRASLTSDAAERVPCNIGQDEVIDCRICSGTNPACQPPP